MLRDIIYIVFKWADNNVVTFDDLKSELIHFETTYKMTREPIQLPNGTIIHPSECIRWLGIWFDRKLSFNTYIKQKKTLMLRAFNAIQNLSNTERGLIRGAMRQLCMSTVLSVSDYGSELWFRNQRTQVKSIQTV